MSFYNFTYSGTDIVYFEVVLKEFRASPIISSVSLSSYSWAAFAYAKAYCAATVFCSLSSSFKSSSAYSIYLLLPLAYASLLIYVLVSSESSPDSYEPGIPGGVNAGILASPRSKSLIAPYRIDEPISGWTCPWAYLDKWSYITY